MQNSRISSKEILEQDSVELLEIELNRLTNAVEKLEESNRYLERESLLNNEGEGVSEEDLEIYRSAIKENKKLVPEYQSKILEISARLKELQPEHQQHRNKEHHSEANDEKVEENDGSKWLCSSVGEMEGRSFELSEDESVDGGEENEDGHGDQLSALRREPSVTFPRGFSSKEDLEIGTPKLGGMMSSGGVFANVDDATNDVGEEDLEEESARRRSMDEFRRPASISSPRRGGLSSAFSAIDLASSTEKPPRAPNAHRVSQEFEEEIDRLRDKFDVNDTSAFSPAFQFKTGEVINVGADSPPVAFYAYAQSPASTSSKHAASVSPRVREGTFLGSSPRSLGTSPGSFTRGGIMGRSGPKPLPTSSSPNFHEPLRREIGFDGAGFKNARERYFEQVTKFLSERFQHEDDYENTWISLRSKSEPSLFKLCKKPLTMGESYQEFFVDHADVFELSEDERHVRLIR